MIPLETLLRRARITPSGYRLPNGDIPISGLAFDSRQVRPGNLFVAVPGHDADGHAFIGDACRQGAVAIVAERPISAPPPVVLVPDARLALSALADAWFEEPSRSVRTIGITGTKGKTTTSYLVRSILQAAGFSCGLLGTIGLEAPGFRIPATNTTPDPLTVHRFLARLRAGNTRFAVMEVSSHALVQRRTDHVRFEAAIFTNLSGEHLDYHRDMESYLEAKARLFDALQPDAHAVIHAAGPWLERLERTRAHTHLFAAHTEGAPIRATDLELSPEGTRFQLHLPETPAQPIHFKLLGRHNVENALAAAGAAHALGIPPRAIVDGLEALEAVPGRLESIRSGQPFTVLVDYAHTDDALARVLEALRAIKPRGARIHCLFGCGGDRDRTKRARMARVAEHGAERVIVTSDNPRTEDPHAIIEDVLAGFSPGFSRLEVEPDRERAIVRAIQGARPGDIVLLAGKGHETVQIIGRAKRPFDDREVAREALAALGYRPQRSPSIPRRRAPRHQGARRNLQP